MPETFRVLWQNKFWIFDASSWLFCTKLITMHGHLTIKYPVCIGGFSAVIKWLCVTLTTHLPLVYLENDNNFHSQILKLLRIVQKIRVPVIILIINQQNSKIIFYT